MSKYKFLNTPDNFTGGKISRFYEQWQLITTDAWILNCVQGHAIETILHPVQHYMPKPIQFSNEETDLIDHEIRYMTQRHIIETVDPSDSPGDEFVSNIFFRHKKHGQIRVILNLKSFNKTVDYHHFKMETLHSAIQLVKANAWFGSIDLKEAFHSVKIIPSHRRFLRFYWKGKKYQFVCMPNGLASAPRVWTKLLKPVFSYLRKLGFANVAYIDDSFLQADGYGQCCQNIRETAYLMDSLGLTVHPSKSVLIPTQEITFVGFVINSILMTVRLTDEKALSLQQGCVSLLDQTRVTIRDLAQVIGKMVASEPGVLYAPLFYKGLEIEKNSFLQQHRGNFDAKVTLSEQSRNLIQWWIENIRSCCKPISPGNPDIILFTDSSNIGWGGVNQTNGTETNGQWTIEERENHINVLELKAALLSVQSLCSDVTNKHVRINLDSTVAISYISKMGGRKPTLNSLARELWLWCKERSIWVSASHIPGILNREADQLSRIHNLDMEWSLRTTVFDKLCRRYGGMVIDLFASKLNCKLPVYVSYSPDGQAYAVDAFTLDWSNFTLIYAFPPFSVLGHCLQKIRDDLAEVVLIAPIWTTQPWFPVLLSLIASQCYVLPRARDILYLPQRPDVKHPLEKMRLGVFRLSGNACRIKEYQKTLLKLSQPPGETLQRLNIGVISNSGCNFALHDKLIHLDLL